MQANLELLTVVIGWIVAVFIGALGLMLLWLIATGKIDLSYLISESSSNKASLSRFQFLLFTFVIVLSLLLVIVGQQPPKFPSEIPAGILALLGISGGSYIISKAIQANRDINLNPPRTPGGSSGTPPTPPNQ